jgi:protein subunit release factor A
MAYKSQQKLAQKKKNFLFKRHTLLTGVNRRKRKIKLYNFTQNDKTSIYIEVDIEKLVPLRI